VAHCHLIVRSVEPQHKLLIRRSICALNDAQNIRVQDNHERLESGLGRWDLRYTRPNLAISSKTGSSANRPAWVRYHLRFTEDLRRGRPSTVCSRAFAGLSI